MKTANPDYPHIVLSFPYRGWTIEIDQGESEGQIAYTAWANYPTGCAVAVPCARSRSQVIQRAKRWVDQRIQKTCAAEVSEL